MELLPEVESAVDALFWDRADRPKRLAALQTLLAAAACEPGVEAIRAHGGVDRLRKALAWDDEDSVDAAAKVLAACSGSTARGPGVRTFVFRGTGAHAHVTHAVRLRETDYVEGGLGWRVGHVAVGRAVGGGHLDGAARAAEDQELRRAQGDGQRPL